MSKSRTELVHRNGGTIVRLVGSIDADFKPPALEDLRGIVVFDLEKAVRITSYGVREWTRMLAALDASEVYFMRAQPAFVIQFNIVDGFAKSGVLLSMHLPYACTACGNTECLLLDVMTQHALVLTEEVPEHHCSACGALAEFDDVPADYYDFVARQPRPVLSDAARGVLDEAPRSREETRLEIHKHIEGDITALWLRGPMSGQTRFKRVLEGLEGKVLVVCGGLTLENDRDANKLLELLHIQDATVWLARVSTHVVRALSREARQSLLGRVASVSAPMFCPSCDGKQRCDIGSWAVTCGSCGHSIAANLAVETRRALQALLDQDVPSNVLDYLQSHRGTSPSTQPARPRSTPPSSRYNLIQQMAAGGMAEVWLAEQRGAQGFSKRVVVKRILPHLADVAGMLDMFLNEARLAARLNHPNVVQIFDLERDASGYSIAMEYVPGIDAHSLLAMARSQQRQIPVEVVCRIVADMCAGLHAAHEHCDDDGQSAPIIHRDISPSNVLVSQDGAVKLTDFGIAKSRGLGAAKVATTEPGVIKGKLIYLAPEQIDDAYGTVDAQSDIFAAGLVMREMLTGTNVFQRPNEFATLWAVLAEPIPDVRTGRPDVPASVADVVAKALARKKSERFQTASDMQAALEDALRAMDRPVGSSDLARWLKTLGEDPMEPVLGLLSPQTPATGTSDSGARDVLEVHGEIDDQTELLAQMPRRGLRPR